MSTNIKTVPNQKVITINKEKCGNGNLYAAINLEAMNKAAIDLDGNCFKLWIYMAKNQNNYNFALSSKDADESFGLKKKAYDRAIAVLQEKKYLINVGGNQFNFYEVARTDAEVEEINKSLYQKDTTENNTLYQNDTTVLYQKDTSTLYQKDTRNIKDTTLNNTNNNNTTSVVSAYSRKTSVKKFAEGFTF